MIKILELLCWILLVTTCQCNVCKKYEISQEYQGTNCLRYQYDNYYYNYNNNKCDQYETLKKTLFTYGICENVQILDTNVVSNLPHDPKYMTFINSNITTIKVGTFNSLTGVKELYLNNTQLTSIQAGVFSGLSQLETLRLENNRLNEIYRGTLNSLFNLVELNFTNNKLSVLEENCFNGLLSLTRLDLSHNNLTSISNETFVSLHKLEELYLDYNHIAKLEGGVFYELPKISHLSLSNNQLSEFSLVLLKSEDLSEDDKVVKSIDVSYNQIKLIADWSKLRNIENINLGYNKITHLSSIGENVIKLNLGHNLIENLNSSFFILSSQTLNELVLSNNAIAKIDKNSFKNLYNLKNLALDNNRLSDIPIGIFKNMSSLETLYLSHNALENLNFGTFVGLQNLKKLKLSNNRLASITESSLHVLNSLLQLDLSHNTMQHLNIEALLVHLKSLKDIWLNGNLLTCDELLIISNFCKNKSVTFHEGTELDHHNVYGIKCFDSANDFTTEKGPSSMTISEQSVRELLDKLKEMRENFGPELSRRLDESLRNSTLFRLLNSSVDNLALIDYLQKDFPNSDFVKFFRDQSLRNFSNFDNFNHTNLYRFFNDEFYNSTFYKYFEKDYRNGELFSKLETNRKEEMAEIRQLAERFFKLENERENKTINTADTNINYVVFLSLVILCFITIILMFAFLLYKSSRFMKRVEYKLTSASVNLI